MANLLEVDLQEIVNTYPEEEFTGRLNQQMIRGAMEIYIPSELEDILTQVCDLKFLKDRRTPTQYGLDLIYGWLMEDIALKFLQNNGYEPKRNGVDAQRVFLKDFEISSVSDITINDRHLDIYFDSHDMWIATDSMDVRESKWNALRSVGGAILCFSPSGVGFVDVAKEENLGIWANPAWGFKQAVSVNNMRSRIFQEPKLAMNIINEYFW